MDDLIVSVRIQGSKNPLGQAAHDARRKAPGYLQEDRGSGLVVGSTEPEAIREAEAGVREAYKARHGRAMPKNANPILVGVITFGTSREKGPGEGLNAEELAKINNLPREEMDAAAKRYCEWLQIYHGVKVIGLSVHRDETCDHYHFMATNYSSYTGKTLTNGLSRKDFSDLQDVAGDCFAPVGAKIGQEFKRGQKRKVKSCDHVSVAEGHRLQLQHLSDKERKLIERTQDYDRRIDAKQAEGKEVEKDLERLKKTLHKIEEGKILEDKQLTKFRASLKVKGLLGSKEVEAPAGYMFVKKSDAKQFRDRERVLLRHAETIERGEDLNEKETLLKELQAEIKGQAEQANRETRENKALKARINELEEENRVLKGDQQNREMGIRVLDVDR